jgi:hypothetical protein
MNPAKAAKSRRQENRDRGAILMVVLIVMIALLGLGMTGLFLTSGSIQMSSNINLRNQALVVAEAGIERARVLLNNPAVSPNMPALLRPAVSNPADELIENTNQCQGERRGAILIDNGIPLAGINYPSVNRSSDLPGTGAMGGSPPLVSSTMGQYTVYIRQDVRDCRMSNFYCDISPSGGIDAGAGGLAACTPPLPVVAPNGVVIVRSEAVASDGRTRVALEVTMSPSQGTSLGPAAPLSALCAAGVNGCDDNSATQGGLVVVGNPPPSNGGAAGSGAGGAAGAAGAAGNGGGGIGGDTTGSLPGAGAAGGAAGTGASPGAGGTKGTGGSTGCKSGKCARIATIGVWGVWNQFLSPSTNDSGSAMFRQWLDENNSSCQAVGSFTDFGQGKLLQSLGSDPLKDYNVLILLDLYHSNAQRWGCISHFGTNGTNGCWYNKVKAGQQGQSCYGDVSATVDCPARDPSGPNPKWSGLDCTKCPAGTASYMNGDGAPGGPLALSDDEVAYITSWVKKGNGILSTMSYHYGAPQTYNANRILAPYGLAFETTGMYNQVYHSGDPNYPPDDPHLQKVYEWGPGIDLCSTAPTGSPACPGGDGKGDFLRPDTPGHYPFDFLYLKTGDATKWVRRMELRGGAPILSNLTQPSIVPAGLGTIELATRVQCARGLTGKGPNTAGTQVEKCNSALPAACNSSIPASGVNPGDVGYTVKDIKDAGDTGPGGRVFAWGDEWLTYNTLWSAWSQNVYDPGDLPCKYPDQVPYQAAAFWANIIAWLSENSLLCKD